MPTDCKGSGKEGGSDITGGVDGGNDSGVARDLGAARDGA